MRTVEVFGEIGLEPNNYPYEVLLIVTMADRETHALLGGCYKLQPEPWAALRHRWPISEDKLIEIEGYLSGGKVTKSRLSLRRD